MQNIKPQLPLIDETTIIINNSTLELLRCPRELLYKIGLRRVPSAPKPSQFFGQGIHIGLAQRAILFGSDEVTDNSPIINEMVKHFNRCPPPVGDHRTLDYAVSIMDAYNKQYGKEPFKLFSFKSKPVIESSLMEYLGSVSDINVIYRVMYAGRIDLCVEDNEGLWVWDHKTAYQFGTSWEDEMRVSPQFRGYMWAIWKITGIMPRGFKVNGIKVRPPTKAMEAGLESRVRPKEDFLRLTEHVQPDEVYEWEGNTIEKISELVKIFCRGTFPKHESMCVGKYGKCGFYDVCRLPQENRQEYLNSGLFMVNDWSPINIPSI